MKIEENYICSLLGKPFVILTGASGTGKTRLAIQVAEAIEKNEEDTMIKIEIDKDGKITNKNEEYIKSLCEESNLFNVTVNEKVYPIKIVMCTHVESDDDGLISVIESNEKTEICLNISSENLKNKNYELVAVGADWTDVRYLLGYTNPFGEDGKKTYEITAALIIILRALHPKNRYKPYFLVLDEMNLSHVERYFSTFLSAMEASRSTSEPIILINRKELELIRDVLKDHDELKMEYEATEALILENKGVCLPQNLFIVGTINVDETTYMFSPKVLDRAHVIELNTENPKKYFESLNTDQLKSKITFDLDQIDEILNKFEESIKNRTIDEKNPLKLLKESITDLTKQNEVIDNIKQIIEGIYLILEPCNFAYGFRIINEVLEYIKYSIDFKGVDIWIEILDNAVLQKILPKIHGNRREIGECLISLDKFLSGESSNYKHGNEVKEVNQTGIKLIKSKEKIDRMIDSLNYSGYTSFIS